MSDEQRERGGDEEMRALVKRLARPHSSGGDVVERAALMASGEDFNALIEWITDHHGVAEVVADSAPRQGLHGARVGIAAGAGASSAPARFVLPAGTLG